MEILIIIAAFCLSLSFLLTPCVSDQEQLQESRIPQVFNDAKVTAPSLPRKFQFKIEANVKNTDEDFAPSVKPIHASSGNKLYHKEENVMHAAKGTWREWVEGPNKSEYFTMDYAWVRRRRPIHNKRMPVTP